MKKIILSLCLLCIMNMAWCVPDKAEQEFLKLKQSIHLGQVKFAAKTNNDLAYQHFELGVAFLHAFMYELAIEQFRQAQQLDPHFAMAYWGEAMSYKEALWEVESVDKARKALARYHKNNPSPLLPAKEQDYLHAVQDLFGAGDIISRDHAYMLDMKKMYERYPKDPNVAAFYALSLLGMITDNPQAKENARYLKQGRTLINQLFSKYPDHPGVVHYTMHYYDESSPALAEKGMKAAAIALNMMYSSSHVTHMSAHIYRRLGLWKAFNRANLISIKASDDLCLRLAKFNQSKEQLKQLYVCDADNKYHSLEWLQYGYLQTGQIKKARDLLKRMQQVVAMDSALPFTEWYYRMWARQRLTEANWKTPGIKIEPISKGNEQLYWSAYTECGALLAKGLSQAKTEKQSELKQTYHRLNMIIRLSRILPDDTINHLCRMNLLEIQASQAWQQGREKEGNKLIEQAIRVQQETPSTATSPSLDFLPPQLLYAQHLSQYTTAESRNLRKKLYQDILSQKQNDLRALRGMRSLKTDP